MADNSSREVSNLEENKTVGDISVRVDVDVSDALTGLKAVQREARNAAKAVRELESVKVTDVSLVPTSQLVEELAKREGVEETVIAPHTEKATLSVDHGDGFNTLKFTDGPARILAVID